MPWVSAEVKNAGKDIEVNAINTVFGRDAISDVHDELIYTSENITPEQQVLLNGNNPRQYPAERESAGKGKKTSDTVQGNEGIFSKTERIAAKYNAEQEVKKFETEEEAALRDALIDMMKSTGLDDVPDSEEAQKMFMKLQRYSITHRRNTMARRWRHCGVEWMMKRCLLNLVLVIPRLQSLRKKIKRR